MLVVRILFQVPLLRPLCRQSWQAGYAQMTISVTTARAKTDPLQAFVLRVCSRCPLANVTGSRGKVLELARDPRGAPFSPSDSIAVFADRRRWPRLSHGCRVTRASQRFGLDLRPRSIRSPTRDLVANPLSLPERWLRVDLQDENFSSPIIFHSGSIALVFSVHAPHTDCVCLSLSKP